MRKLWLTGGVLAVIVAGVAVVVVTRAKSGDADDKKKAEVALEFTTQEVVRPVAMSLPMRIEFSGPLVAPRTAVVRAKAAGTLVSLSVAEGNRVRAGQSLGSIDLSDWQSRVTDRSAAVDSAQAALAEAERQHAANVSLAEQKFISPTALQSSQARLDAASAALKSAQAQLATTRIGMREASLVAPISGVVSKRSVVPGEKLSIEQPIVSIVDLSELELAGAVGTHEVSRLAPGMAVEVRVEGVDQPVAGRLVRIAPAAEPGTRSIGVTVALPNPDETLRAGQYALARVVLPDPAARLTLPALAVVSAGGQEQIWVLENGVLARRSVATGRRDQAQGLIEVTGGVTPTTQVVATRFDNLREGQKATVVARPEPVASAGQAASAAAR
ncbi:MAG TPA: efflux RND transporter periplasmic adaptor subunit [Burkholderiaceae bacterium]|nr:efflux RND transporter periplasmic adaptor subunit [Burkholderiaceae bacterium]